METSHHFVPVPDDTSVMDEDDLSLSAAMVSLSVFVQRLSRRGESLMPAGQPEIRSSLVFKALPWACGMAVTAIGCFVLVAQLFDFSALIAALPSLTKMKASTAAAQS